MSVDKMARANGMRWYGHVLRRDDCHVLRNALEFEVEVQRKRGLTKSTLRRQVEEEIKKIGLRKEDATYRERWQKIV